jgi:hypothetical protein
LLSKRQVRSKTASYPKAGDCRAGEHAGAGISADSAYQASQRVSLPSPDKVRAGAAPGLRFQKCSISWNAALAWRTDGGKPEIEAKALGSSQAWLEMRYNF